MKLIAATARYDCGGNSGCGAFGAALQRHPELVEGTTAGATIAVVPRLRSE